MADWHGGSTLGGYPLVVKSGTDNSIPRFSGRLLINSSITDNGMLATLKDIDVTGTSIFRQLIRADGDIQTGSGIKLSEAASKSYVDEQITNVSSTGIPKLNSYPFALGTSTAGQRQFTIPMDLFDSTTDTLMVYIGSSYSSAFDYVVTNTVRDVNGNLTARGYFTLNDLTGVEAGVVVDIIVLKNVPIGADGSINGVSLAVNSVPLDRVQNAFDKRGGIVSGQIISTVPIGTAPWVVTSTTEVVNLNVGAVNGFKFDQSLKLIDSPTFVAVSITQDPISANQLTSKSYVDNQIASVSSTGIPKLNSYPFTLAPATSGQRQFTIPMDLFDSITDTLMVYIGSSYAPPSEYVVTNTVRDGGGTVTARGYFTLNEPTGVNAGVIIDIIVLKNVPIGVDGSINGAALAVNSIPFDRVQNAFGISSVIPIGNGGTGSTTKNFVDLATAQNISGIKTFDDRVSLGGLSGPTFKLQLYEGNAPYHMGMGVNMMAANSFDIAMGYGDGQDTQFNVGAPASLAFNTFVSLFKIKITGEITTKNNVVDNGVGVSSFAAPMSINGSSPVMLTLTSSNPGIVFQDNINTPSRSMAGGVGFGTVSGSYGTGKGDLNLYTLSYAAGATNAINFMTAADDVGGFLRRMTIARDGTVAIVGNLSLGSAGGEKFYIYNNGAIKFGMGVDLVSTAGRELNIFHSTSNNADGRISLGWRREGDGVHGAVLTVLPTGVSIAGSYSATGTKSAIVPTMNYDDQLLYAMESPENRFEDFYEVMLDINGHAVVEMDPIFLETVEIYGDDYQVYVQGTIKGLYAITERNITNFVVEGEPNARVMCRAIAWRYGYKDLRFNWASIQ
jgi:hypothetical protein